MVNPMSRHRNATMSRHRRKMPAGVQAARVAVAFTAPIMPMASTDMAMLRRVSRRVMSGHNTQGASMTGQVSEEMVVSVLSTRGERA